MTKNILQEYFAAFRWGRIRECYKGNNLWFFIYSITFLPFSLMGVNRSKENLAVYFLLMLPVLFHLLVLPLHPVRLPKIMYLCPMSREERRNYLKRTLEVKTGISVLIQLLAFALLFFAGRYSSFLLLLALFLGIMIILETAMQERTVGSTGTLTTAWEWWETGTLIVYVMEYWVLLSRILWAEPCSSTEKILYPLILLAVDLPLLLKVLSFWKEKLETRISYENPKGQKAVENRKNTGKG